MTSPPSTSSQTLFGIGYEGRTLHQVIDLLVSGSVEVVVDVTGSNRPVRNVNSSLPGPTRLVGADLA